MRIINFWLDTCVLPRETMQFPSRLVANAFNLTDNPRGDLRGFSGTKDNHLLLPTPVTQCTPDRADELRATDGKMASLILSNDEVVRLETQQHTLSQAVMNLLIDRKAAALIDAGATMAGLSNAQVAERLIKDLPKSSCLQGVVYFETEAQTWYVLNLHGRRWPQSSSPLHERDCLVYFDESRCRGADMKLKTDAMAVLTIGPSMGKSKLMQAAGRLRKLDRGQKILFAVPPELALKVSDEQRDDLSSLGLLKWVVRNTAEATANGIPEYSTQASHFCMTQDPKARLLDENIMLADLYGSAVAEDNASAVVKRTFENDRARCEKLGIEYNETAVQISAQVKSLADKYGSDVCVTSTGVEAECERELENERELEKEREQQLPKQAPVFPTPWPFAELLTAASPMVLPAAAGVLGLERAICDHFDRSLNAIPWKDCRIFVTQAFACTVIDSLGAAIDQSQFMRPVDAIVVFPGGEVLLLSEWEADNVLQLLWDSASIGNRPFMVNLAYLRDAADKQLPPAQICLRVPSAPKAQTKAQAKVDDITVAGLQLLAGETMFATEARKQSVKTLAATTVGAKQAALLLVELRGLQHMISRSDLEAICNTDLGEA